MVKVSISISLTEELFNKLETERKLVNRSRFVEFILSNYFDRRGENAR